MVKIHKYTIVYKLSKRSHTHTQTHTHLYIYAHIHPLTTNIHIYIYTIHTSTTHKEITTKPTYLNVFGSKFLCTTENIALGATFNAEFMQLHRGAIGNQANEGILGQQRKWHHQSFLRMWIEKTQIIKQFFASQKSYCMT